VTRLLAVLPLLAACSPSGAPGRVLVLGVDGLDRRLVERMSAAGDLPALSRMMREGFVADVAERRPILSPVVWTTYASGYRGQVHGIGGWTDASGHPYTAADARVRRLWDTATAAGVTADVVGWLMTWPVSPIQGTLVSDRFVWTLPLDKPRDGALEAVDREQHDRLAATVWPGAFAAEAEACVPDDAALAAHPLGYQVAASGTPYHPLGRDLAHLCMLEAAWEEDGARVGLAYLAGPDQVSHLYWPFTEEWLVRRMIEDPEARGRAVRDAWAREGEGRRPYPLPEGGDRRALEEAGRWVPDMVRFVDEAAARVLALAGPADTVIVLSDHGFRASPSQPLLHGSHGDRGVLLAWGARLAARGDGGVLEDVDVGPTLLALAGLPVAGDMPGRARDDLFELGPVAREPTARLDRIGAVPPPDLTPAWEQLQRQLEALGYLGPGRETSPGRREE
jgi:hypothetical protein